MKQKYSIESSLDSHDYSASDEVISFFVSSNVANVVPEAIGALDSHGTIPLQSPANPSVFRV